MQTITFFIFAYHVNAAEITQTTDNIQATAVHKIQNKATVNRRHPNPRLV